MEKAQVYSKLRYARISPKKVAPVLDLVRGKDASEAERILKFDHSKGAKLALKTLKTAVADAKNNHKLEGDLFVSETHVSPGPLRRTGRFGGRYFNPIIKRSSHIVFGLSEKKK